MLSWSFKLGENRPIQQERDFLISSKNSIDEKVMYYIIYCCILMLLLYRHNQFFSQLPLLAVKKLKKERERDLRVGFRFSESCAKRKRKGKKEGKEDN